MHRDTHLLQCIGLLIFLPISTNHLFICVERKGNLLGIFGSQSGACGSCLYSYLGLQDQISKITTEKWAGSVAPEEECLFSECLLCKCEALCSNPSFLYFTKKRICFSHYNAIFKFFASLNQVVCQALRENKNSVTAKIKYH